MTDLKLYGYKQYFDELSNIYLNKKLPNKIIFSGRKGIGKCYFVNHFINFILSINEEYSYDSNNNLINQNNKSFNLVKNNSHPNFYKIKKEDGKKNIDISQIRNLYDFVNRSSFNNKLKIVLIEDIENLSINSSNALLKLIEEPNKNVQYFLIHDISKSRLKFITSENFLLKYLDAFNKFSFFESLYLLLNNISINILILFIETCLFLYMLSLIN